MHYLRQEWKREGDTWCAVIDDRFRVVTWPFGNIHQCKVFVDYKYSRVDAAVEVCLAPCTTYRTAMKKGLDWVKNYLEHGSPSAAEVFNDCYNHYPDLYLVRTDVINQIFFTLGGGYCWLDGKIFCVAPDEYAESLQRGPLVGKNAVAAILKIAPDLAHIFNPEKIEVGPLPDSGGQVAFYPVAKEYANICHVPDDVTDEWLTIAYEAAVLLRDRSDTKSSEAQAINRDIGTEVVSDLVSRFAIRLFTDGG